MNHKRIQENWIVMILTVGWILLYACNPAPKINQGKADKGIMADMLPTHIAALYDVSLGGDSAYHQKAKVMYLDYLQKGQRDSALLCLIAWQEVIDQNYIEDPNALYLAVEHFNNGYHTSENQAELMKLGYYIGSLYFTFWKPDSATYWFSKTLNDPQTLPRTKVKCRVLLGNIYSNKNKMDSAILLKQANMEYYKSIGDTMNYGLTCSNLGSDYHYIYAYQLAMDYTNEALRIAVLLKDTFSQVMVRQSLMRIIARSQVDTALVKENILAMNALMSTYSKPNLALKFSLADANIEYHALRRQLDSLKYWIDIYKVICDQQGDIAATDYVQIRSRYELLSGKPLSSPEALGARAHFCRREHLYKEAYAYYKLLHNNARLTGNVNALLAYKDTLAIVNKELDDATSKGKIFELEVKYKTQIKDQQIQLKELELENRNRTILSLAALLAMLALGFIIYMLRQKQRMLKIKKEQEERFLQQLMDQTEEERKRIAQDLHDGVGHELLNVRRTLGAKEENQEAVIDKIINEIREISRNLFPVMFEEVGLNLSILQLAEKIYQSDQLFVITEINYTKGKLDTKSELNIYRIIQEALTNTIKYANAQSAKIEITESASEIKVSIRDNGKGFNLEEVLHSGKAFGLYSIRKRCEFLKARLHIHSDANGTVYDITIPITIS